jgi:hypothetical protein
MPSFYPLGSFRTVKVLTGQSTIDVQYVTCATIPTGITFAYGVPIDSWQGGVGPGIGLLDSIAVQLEELVTNLHVVAGTAITDLDANGLLEDKVSVTVEYDRGGVLPSLFGTVDIPVDNFLISDTGIGGLVIPPPGGLTPSQQVQAEYQRLAALAGA